MSRKFELKIRSVLYVTLRFQLGTSTVCFVFVVFEFYFYFIYWISARRYIDDFGQSLYAQYVTLSSLKHQWSWYLFYCSHLNSPNISYERIQIIVVICNYSVILCSATNNFTLFTCTSFTKIMSTEEYGKCVKDDTEDEEN